MIAGFIGAVELRNPEKRPAVATTTANLLKRTIPDLIEKAEDWEVWGTAKFPELLPTLTSGNMTGTKKKKKRYSQFQEENPSSYASVQHRLADISGQSFYQMMKRWWRRRCCTGWPSKKETRRRGVW